MKSVSLSLSLSLSRIKSLLLKPALFIFFVGFLFLGLAGQAWGAAVTKANMRISAVAGSAFVDFNEADSLTPDSGYGYVGPRTRERLNGMMRQ